MSAGTTTHDSAPSGVNYLTNGYSLKSWLLTVDHKRIAILYLISITIFFALGGIFAAAVRLELLTPQGDMMDAETYNKMFTMHGVVMIFFFLIPSVPATLGNFLIPIMVGAKDLAFPKINLLSWYLYIIGGMFGLYVAVSGGIETGWTFYTPYSSTYSNSAVIATAMGAFVAGFSSILTGLNFIVTIHKMRAPGLTWGRLPLFVWAHYATSLIQLLGTPVVAITLVLMMLERAFRIGFFDPALGGDPVLFQHLFWFYSHPAVYIMILPGMGVISEVVTCYSKKGVFGYHFIAGSSLAIAVLGFFVWGHHMYTAGQSTYAGVVFSLITFAVAVPSAVKIFNWTATMYRGSIRVDTPMLYALGFIGLFTVGGVTGVMLATMALDLHLHDTYFVVAHFHFVMVGGMVLAFMSGLHFWWPKMTGKIYPEIWGRVSAVLVFLGFNFTFFPQFLLGYMGMPRRYHAYPEEWQVLHVMSTIGASVLMLGFVLPAIYLTWSVFKGKAAEANPWQAKGLEWNIPSPPPTENFPAPVVVNEEVYAYSHEEVKALV
ncbi:MAG: cytochrome c oxidase subunit I [Bryobacterales bacterium]|nr:cytochrome c oxidase subunit I [Bryobacterales bacterium]